MREFEDAAGRRWHASVREIPGPDYKGRIRLVFEPVDGDGSMVVASDVRWNSERTARRTLETMSRSELEKRLSAAVGRSPAALAR